jgi:tetratricopeptide (TPR) repeat protein
MKWRTTLAVAAAAAGLSLNTVGNEFVLDDRHQVISDPRTARVSLREAFATGYWHRSNLSGLYRPLTRFGFSLERAVFGLEPAGYHLVNLALHGVVTAFVALFAARLAGWSAGLVAGLLFAAHPVHAEAVAQAVGLSDLLCGVGVLGALLAFARYRGEGGIGWLAITMAAYAVALAAKESAAPLPLVVAALDPALRRESPREALRAFPGRLPVYLLLAVPLAVYLAARHAALGYWTLPAELAGAPHPDPVRRAFPFAHLDAGVRVLTGLRVLARYALLVFAPVRMSSWYGYDEVPEARTPFEGAVLAGGVVLLALLAALGAAARRPGPALVALALVLATWLPVSHLPFPVGTVMGERLLYLPTAGLALLAGAGFARLEGRWRRAAGLAVALAVALLGARTWARNRDLATDLDLWRSSAAGAPRAASAHVEYGQRLYELGRARGDERLARAGEAAVHHGLSINPDSVTALNRLGLIATDRQQFPDAERYLRRALDVDPRDPNPAFNMGRNFFQQGRYDEAAPWMARALELEGAQPDPLHLEWSVINAGLRAQAGGALAAAEDAFRKALERAPRSAEAAFRLGHVRALRGAPGEAEEWFRRAIGLDPRYRASVERLRSASGK